MHTRPKSGPQLYKHSCPQSKIFSELLGGTGFLLFEDAIEIGDVVEPAMIRDLRNGMRGVDQHPGSVPQPYLIETVDKGIARAFFDKAAKRHIRHAYQ